jgi:prephenate dehydrogenase
MKDLRQIIVIELGLLGGSTTLRILRSLSGVKAVGNTHRPSTRKKGRQPAVATEIADNIHESVSCAELVIPATPIYRCENIFSEICEAITAGRIVTNVGSTKVLPRRRQYNKRYRENYRRTIENKKSKQNQNNQKTEDLPRRQ